MRFPGGGLATLRLSRRAAATEIVDCRPFGRGGRREEDRRKRMDGTRRTSLTRGHWPPQRDPGWKEFESVETFDRGSKVFGVAGLGAGW